MSSPLAALPLHGSGLRGSSSAPPTGGCWTSQGRRCQPRQPPCSPLQPWQQPNDQEGPARGEPPKAATYKVHTCTIDDHAEQTLHRGFYQEVHPPTVSPSLPLSDGGSGRRRRARSSESPRTSTETDSLVRQVSARITESKTTAAESARARKARSAIPSRLARSACSRAAWSARSRAARSRSALGAKPSPAPPVPRVRRPRGSELRVRRGHRLAGWRTRARASGW